MSHPLDLLSAYVDDELTREEQVAVASHIATCSRCTEEVGGLTAVKAWIRGLPMLEPPAVLLPTVRRASRHVMAAVASAAAAVVLAVAIVPSRPDAVDLGTLADQHTARVVVDPGISTIRGEVNGP